ncbi:MAG TPA: TIGR03088 family PEP-CTERM/XrtA system glycosyltransferase [Casimicrobiaceae bacterium]|jgi:sugar transferase (PEP-CTERM/EpsH1 system associated)
MIEQRPLILHVIHHLFIGGLENGLVNLVNRLPESRFRHAIACIEDDSDFRNRLRRRDVDVYPLHRSRIGIWRTRAEIYRLCRRLRPTIVHTRNLSGLDALLPARLAGVSHTVHGEHGWNVEDLDGAHWKPALLRRLHSPLVGRYVTVSKDLERYLVSRVGIAPARVSQIYNGVETERFAPVQKKPVGVLPNGFLDSDPVVIGTVGRVQSVKDQATLVRAFAQVVKTHPDLAGRVRLVIVGDGPLAAALRTLVRDLEIEPLVWMSGAVDDVARILQAFDVFVLPSLAEGISNTVLEAMATALPVLATAVGGNREIVDDATTGKLFQPQDVATLRQLLVDYIRNPALRNDHGRAARRSAVERFSLEVMVENYQALYASLCRGSRNESSGSQHATSRPAG